MMKKALIRKNCKVVINDSGEIEEPKTAQQGPSQEQGFQQVKKKLKKTRVTGLQLQPAEATDHKQAPQ